MQFLLTTIDCSNSTTKYQSLLQLQFKTKQRLNDCQNSSGNHIIWAIVITLGLFILGTARHSDQSNTSGSTLSKDVFSNEFLHASSNQPNSQYKANHKSKKLKLPKRTRMERKLDEIYKRMPLGYLTPSTNRQATKQKLRLLIRLLQYGRRYRLLNPRLIYSDYVSKWEQQKRSQNGLSQGCTNYFYSVCRSCYAYSIKLTNFVATRFTWILSQLRTIPPCWSLPGLPAATFYSTNGLLFGRSAKTSQQYSPLSPIIRWSQSFR
jgi:hypothetical protein